MPLYNYKAIDVGGKFIRGSLDAGNVEDLEFRLEIVGHHRGGAVHVLAPTALAASLPESARPFLTGADRFRRAYDRRPEVSFRPGRVQGKSPSTRGASDKALQKNTGSMHLIPIIFVKGFLEKVPLVQIQTSIRKY